ncbi:hypothetical protein, partial [Shinella sp. AETb1-6]|uniref:hypothetical protein n=1 Tax=Shinella sp. AETb1-6 TaxID=2692210 RepID=UPI001AED9303
LWFLKRNSNEGAFWAAIDRRLPSPHAPPPVQSYHKWVPRVENGSGDPVQNRNIGDEDAFSLDA